jgi:hypothetical protein
MKRIGPAGEDQDKAEQIERQRHHPQQRHRRDSKKACR